MARLRFKTAGFKEREVELLPGINYIGRALGNDVLIDHITVSGTHCEIELGFGQVTVRDCGSTNGIAVGGTIVADATLLPGQTLRIGGVELLVEGTDVPISIPRFDKVNAAAPPKILTNGKILCREHETIPAAYRCTHCREVMCEDCVHRLRRRGGKLLMLCHKCSFPVEPIAAEKKKKKSLFRRLQETTKLFFSRTLSART